MTVTRKGHAHEGKVLRVIGRQKRADGLELRVRLPDGSRLHIPAAWTDMLSNLDTCAGTGRLTHFLHLRSLIDSLLGRRIESVSWSGENHAVEPGIHRGKGKKRSGSPPSVGEAGGGGPLGGGGAAGSPHRPNARGRTPGYGGGQ